MRFDCESERQMSIGRWTCTRENCKRVVEFDGHMSGIFAWRRRNKKRQWNGFTRGLLDQVLSYSISGRSTCTAATRHFTATISYFDIRSQDLVKVGTLALRAYIVPPESARCPVCGPNPEFIVIDAQALRCTDTIDTHAYRSGENCPVLSIENAKLCALESAGLRGAVDKILPSPKQLTAVQTRLVAEGCERTLGSRHHRAEVAATNVFFGFFPVGDESQVVDGSPVEALVEERTKVVRVSSRSGGDVNEAESDDDNGGMSRTLEDAVRQDDDGNLVLGGPERNRASMLRCGVTA